VVEVDAALEIEEDQPEQVLPDGRRRKPLEDRGERGGEGVAAREQRLYVERPKLEPSDLLQRPKMPSLRQVLVVMEHDSLEPASLCGGPNGEDTDPGEICAQPNEMCPRRDQRKTVISGLRKNGGNNQVTFASQSVTSKWRGSMTNAYSAHAAFR
jgi:hypothetical protein